MIKMLRTERGFAAVVVCDACGKRITDGGQAVALNSDTDKVSEMVSAYHAHKGACHDAVEQRIGSPGQTVGWEEFSAHIFQAVTNSGLTLEGLAEEQEMRAEAGL